MMKKVCVLEGNIRERMGRLEQIKASLPDHELYTFDSEDQYEHVEQMISEISCFGERRIFLVKELPQITIKSRKAGGKASDNKSQMRTKVLNSFKKMIPDIPLGNIVVFNNIGISSDGFLKEVAKYGTVYNYKQKISKLESNEKIINYFSERKIVINDDVAELISSSLIIMGSDIDVDKLDLLLLKLYNYVYGKTSITKKDVFAICSTSQDFIIWSLYNIFDGNDGEDKKTKYSRSYKMAYDYLINAKNFSVESMLLFQSMLWRYGILLLSKSGVYLGHSKQDIEQEISNIRKLKREGKAQKMRMLLKEDREEYSGKTVNGALYQRRGFDVLSQYTYDELLSIYKTISMSLVKIRSEYTKYTNSEIVTLLQVVFLTICGELRYEDCNEVLTPTKMIRRRY